MILGDIYERNALHAPNHPAIRYEGRTITHREFFKRACRLANALAAQGIRPGDRIAVLAQNCPEYLEIYAACELAGFITVGINYRLAPPEQAVILADCEPSILLFEAQYADRLPALRDAMPKDTRLLCMDGTLPGIDRYDVALAKASDARPATRPAERDTAFMIYTSGTTGKPKGVMLSHAGQLELYRTISASLSAAPTDRKLIVMPYYHIGAKIEQMNYTLVGATIILHRAFDAKTVLESLANERATSAHLAPTMIQTMLDVPGCRDYDLSSLHTICYASAPMSVALCRQAIATFGPIFAQVYGLSESATATLLHKHQHALDSPPEQVRRLASAGQAMLGNEIRIVAADGSDCATGEVGEVWGRSKAMMQGYWRNPQATAEALTPDGWMRIGDMGYRDDEGYLYIVDRKKDMIISGGENIYSREVEEALMLHPAILEAAVIGVPDQKWGESVKAFVACKPGATTTEAALIEHCRANIASYKKPRTVEFVAALPRMSSTNKVDKKKLREPYWAGRDRQV
jgi:acyl-CoA synthetase (AMP-forming)/AMP-acid ligase II